MIGLCGDRDPVPRDLEDVTAINREASAECQCLPMLSHLQYLYHVTDHSWWLSRPTMPHDNGSEVRNGFMIIPAHRKSLQHKTPIRAAINPFPGRVSLERHERSALPTTHDPRGGFLVLQERSASRTSKYSILLWPLPNEVTPYRLYVIMAAETFGGHLSPAAGARSRMPGGPSCCDAYGLTGNSWGRLGQALAKRSCWLGKHKQARLCRRARARSRNVRPAGVASQLSVPPPARSGAGIESPSKRSQPLPLHTPADETPHGCQACGSLHVKTLLRAGRMYSRCAALLQPMMATHSVPDYRSSVIGATMRPPIPCQLIGVSPGAEAS
nr:hypothetical protein CFP56_16550 [Quercus suber]